jgi:hypothetical protein
MGVNGYASENKLEKHVNTEMPFQELALRK